jgi:general secretion pathway protein D
MRLGMHIHFAFVVGAALLLGAQAPQTSTPPSSPQAPAPVVNPPAKASPQPLTSIPESTETEPETAPETAPGEPVVRHHRRLHALHALPTAETSQTADVNLNFPGVDVHEAAKAILGDILGLNYAVDPSVSGAITVVTAHPVRKSDVFPILEDSLKAANLGLVRHGDVYTIVPMAEAKREPELVGPQEPAYGTEAIQLHYVSATELKKLLDPLVPENAISQVEPGRNMLLITGSTGERASIRGLIEEFDVNWLHGMAFRMFMPRHTDAKTILPELDQLLNGEGSPSAGIVKLLAVDRINGILAISAQPQYLRDVGRWIGMLDREGEEGGRRLYVYHVQNGRASDLATVLVNAFGGQGNKNAQQPTQTLGTKYPNGLNRPSPVTPFQPAGMPGIGGGIGQSSGGTQSTGTGTTGSSPFDQLGSASSDALGGQQPQVVGQTLQIGVSGEPVTLTSDDSNNAIVIYATGVEYGIIADALRKLDVQPLQVLLEAAIAEVTLTDKLQYGVQWSFGPGTAQFGISKGSGANAAISGVTGVPGFTYILQYGTTINATLAELAGITKLTVLSAPKLVVLNNHTAALEVGQQVPIVTGSAVSTETSGAPIVNSVDYRDTGVILKVTPRVNDSGLVLLDLSQEVSDVATTTSSSIDSPTIDERKIASSIACHDGQTIALGGLITTEHTDNSTGLPVLRDIPVLGHLLFNATDKEQDRTELIVLLTPRVIRDQAQANSITDELKHELKGIAPGAITGEQ